MPNRIVRGVFTIPFFIAENSDSDNYSIDDLLARCGVSEPSRLFSHTLDNEMSDIFLDENLSTVTIVSSDVDPNNTFDAEGYANA